MDTEKTIPIIIGVTGHRAIREKDRLVLTVAVKAELAKQKRNSAYLATHAAEMARIERSNRELKQEVKNAKSDDEIVDIINTVLDRNNNLVQDNGKR